MQPQPREALAEVRNRVARDELPLLSLLQAEPLQLQSSHLSFQEYFAARAPLREGDGLQYSLCMHTCVLCLCLRRGRADC